MRNAGRAGDAGRGIARAAAIPTFLPLCAGSVSIVFDEKVDGTEVILGLADVFTVSLPHRTGKAGFDRFQPEVTGRAIRYLERGIDQVAGREWFRFVAVEAGKGELHTFVVEGPDQGRTRDYALRIKVRRCE